MRVHTQEFKEQIKELGKEIDSRITFGDTIITAEEICSITPVVNTSLLKSVMKELDFESVVKIPQYTNIRYEFGLLVNGSYEYIDYGNYIVKSCEYNEDTKSYSYVCYDAMLFSMKTYTELKSLEILQKEFPMTIRDYIICLCTDIGLTFKNETEEFANFDKILDSDPYANLNYTYRDIFDELSQVTASNICVNTDDQIEIRYLNDTGDTIDEEYLKDINVKFGEKYGPINSIVLSRSAESDNVFRRDEESISLNGLCEIKIIDNQIMNFNNRSDYLDDILEKLNGITYYLNDFTSTGILYYEVCDIYNVQIGENTYNCVLFNDEQKITQGVVENIYTEMPEETETDYQKSDKDDRRLNQVYLIVDKQNKSIESVASEVNEQNSKIAQVTQTANDLNISISNQQTTFDSLNNKIVELEGTLEDMSFNFSTKGLSVGTSNDETNSLLDNTGIKVYGYTTLTAIFNNKGSGIDKLIVTGTAQLGYLKIMKTTESGTKYTDIFHLENLIEDLEDLL